MFSTMGNILTESGQTLLLSLAMIGGKMQITVTPVGGKPDKAVLSQPLQLVGTPEEFDAQFPALITTWQENQTDLETQLGTHISATQKVAAAPKAGGSATVTTSQTAAAKTPRSTTTAAPTTAPAPRPQGPPAAPAAVRTNPPPPGAAVPPPPPLRKGDNGQAGLFGDEEAPVTGVPIHDRRSALTPEPAADEDDMALADL